MARNLVCWFLCQTFVSGFRVQSRRGQQSPHTPRDCYDEDFGAEDQDGFHCDFYVAEECGAADTAVFRSAEMCCVCGGGLRGDNRKCFDGDIDGPDESGYSCQMYNEEDCDGTQDNAKFQAKQMCCVCGGGFGYKLEKATIAPVAHIIPVGPITTTTPAPVTASESHPKECYDMDEDGDADGFHCDFYQEDECGSADTPSFISKEMCCICAGGSRGPDRQCFDMDLEKVDKAGFHCDFYVEDDCGEYDTDQFESKSLCCICNGGSGVKPKPTTTPAPPPGMVAVSTIAPLAPGTCPETQEEIMWNNGCPLDYGPTKSDNHHICKSGGCYTRKLFKRCPGGLCDAPSEAMEKKGFEVPTEAPTEPPKPCPTTREDIERNSGCCVDYGAQKCEFSAFCRSGGCLKPEWGDRCAGGLCPLPSVAFAKYGFSAPTEKTTTTTTLLKALTMPAPPGGQCPTTEAELRKNNGCCLDFGKGKCHEHRICKSGGCYASGSIGKAQHDMQPCVSGLCDAPSAKLASLGVALWEPWCPNATLAEIKKNGNCPKGRTNRLCRTGGCFNPRFAADCKAGLCPAVKEVVAAFEVARAKKEKEEEEAKKKAAEEKKAADEKKVAEAKALAEKEEGEATKMENDPSKLESATTVQVKPQPQDSSNRIAAVTALLLSLFAMW